tara:strand:+ start:763 stop:927 length:165 start_codon:yes stop_codon:yes gene_type:complete
VNGSSDLIGLAKSIDGVGFLSHSSFNPLDLCTQSTEPFINHLVSALNLMDIVDL